MSLLKTRYYTHIQTMNTRPLLWEQKHEDTQAYSHRPRSIYKWIVHSSSQGACVKIETNTPAMLDNGRVYMYNKISTTVRLMGCAAVLCSNKHLQPYSGGTKNGEVKWNGWRGEREEKGRDKTRSSQNLVHIILLLNVTTSAAMH